MTQFEIIYDSSKVGPLQFYNTSTKQFLSAEEAQALSNRGEGRIVIGSVSSATCSVILYDPDSTYWECYYNTDSDKFLCEADATTLAQIGLGVIVAGKIPYVITKENGVYFDVVKNKRVGEQTALQLVSSGVAVLKDKDGSETHDEFVDASESAVTVDDNPKESVNSTCPPSFPSSSVPPSSLSSHGYSSEQGKSSSEPPSSCLKQGVPSSSSGGTSCVQEEKEESFLEKVAPIAAGVAVAGVAIAGVAAAMFFGSGGKDKKRKK